MWINFSKIKSDTFIAFINFKTMIENLISHKIKYFLSYSGFEFMSHRFQTLLCQNGIFCRVLTLHTTRKWYCRAKRHCPIIEIRLTLLANASVPNSYWDSAFQSVVNLINLLPHVDVKPDQSVWRFELIWTLVRFS